MKVSAQGVPHLLRCPGLEVREVRLRPLRLASAAPPEQIRETNRECSGVLIATFN